MSDYQEVTILETRGRRIRCEVTEVHPDAPVFAALIEGDELVDEPETLKVVAMVLLDEKGRAGEVYLEDDDDPTPAKFVQSVVLEDYEEISPSSHDGQPLLKVVLAVQMRTAELAEAFEEGETLSAAADPEGDFEDCFS